LIAGTERDLAANMLRVGTRDDRQLATRCNMLTSAVVTSVAAERRHFC